MRVLNSQNRQETRKRSHSLGEFPLAERCSRSSLKKKEVSSELLNKMSVNTSVMGQCPTPAVFDDYVKKFERVALFFLGRAVN